MITIPSWKITRTDDHIRIAAGACDILIWPLTKHLRTVFPGDRHVEAAPNYDEASLSRARELGYPDTWGMSLHHEISHTFLAEAQGSPVSPTLYGVAIGHYAPRSVWWAEEALVLAFQGYLMTGRYSPELDALEGQHEALAQAFRRLLAELDGDVAEAA